MLQDENQSGAIIFGLIGRVLFWIGLIIIVGHAGIHYYSTGEFVTMVLALVFFPITYMIYPWFFGLWYVFVISMLGYLASTLIGKMPPVE